MIRMMNAAMVKRFHSDNHDQLRTHLADVLAANNFASRIKMLNSLTPYEYICRVWTPEPGSIHPQPHPSDAGTEQLAAIVA